MEASAATRLSASTLATWSPDRTSASSPSNNTDTLAASLGSIMASAVMSPGSMFAAARHASQVSMRSRGVAKQRTGCPRANVPQATCMASMSSVRNSSTA